MTSSCLFFVGQLVLLKENYPGNELEAGTLTKYTDIDIYNTR